MQSLLTRRVGAARPVRSQAAGCKQVQVSDAAPLGSSLCAAQSGVPPPCPHQLTHPAQRSLARCPQRPVPLCRAAKVEEEVASTNGASAAPTNGHAAGNLVEFEELSDIIRSCC